MDNIELLKRARGGDKISKEQLISVNTGLIWSVVRRFLNRGYEKEDLFQIGCIGMIKAIDKFDFNYDVAFSTYAVPMIMGEIKRFLRDDGIVKVSRQIRENQIKIASYRQRYTACKNREPTVDEIEKECQIKREDVIYALEAPDQVMSIDAEDCRSGVDLERFPADNCFEQDLVNKLSLTQAIKFLEKMERDLITLRYYENKTQKQTGEILGLTQVQVSRIEKRVIAKLKMNMA